MPNITMLPDELRTLMADIAHVKLQDFHLGRVLETLATHLAHAHGLEPYATPDEPAPEAETDEASAAPKPKGKGK